MSPPTMPSVSSPFSIDALWGHRRLMVRNVALVDPTPDPSPARGGEVEEDSLAGKPNTLGSLDASSDPMVVFLFFTLFNMFKNISGYLVLDKSK